MKKRWKIVGVVLILLLGCACSQPKDNGFPVLENASSLLQEKNEDFVSQKQEKASFVQETWGQYAKQYNTTHMFPDLYVSGKVWLVGEDCLVELIVANGVTKVVVFPRESIQRVEQTELEAFCTVTVFDKTGKSISLLVSSLEFDLLIAFLP